ncbi:MAG: hypothetical protein ACKOH8_09155 [Gemmatimonadota bacterium]
MISTISSRLHAVGVALVGLMCGAPLVVPALHAQAPSQAIALAIPDAKTRQAVEREIARAVSRGLPSAPLVAKAMEGITKQAPPDRIRSAVAAQAQRREQARGLLGPTPSEAELVSGAEALAAGIPTAMLKQVRAAWPAQSVVMPLDVLTELVARGVPPKQALERVVTLMRRGATPVQIAGLGAAVQADVAAGLAPDAALEVRARGVMSLLPSPAAAAALAPSGRRP